jgi:hypothetical protein
MKTIAIHQPNYLPWLGYFYKIAQADVFVFLDDVEYTKRSFTRRVHIRKAKGSQEKAYLIVPLKRHSDDTLICKLAIDHSQNWQKKQLNQLSNTYNGAPAYEKISMLVSGWMEQSVNYQSLAEWNQFLIQQISSFLGLSTTFVRSSDLPVAGKATELNRAIVRHLDGTIYLSGQGARKYQREEDFRQEGIQLQYSAFRDLPYAQQQGDWLGGLSVLDGLMNGFSGWGEFCG